MFPQKGTLQETVRFYESLARTELDMDMDIPEAGLHVVGVGEFLILEMDPAKLDRIDQAKLTHVTVLAPHLDEAVRASVDHGAEVVQERWQSLPGPGYRLRHPDGLLVEYLEHRPSPDDADSPGELFGSGVSCQRRAATPPLEPATSICSIALGHRPQADPPLRTRAARLCRNGERREPRPAPAADISGCPVAAQVPGDGHHDKPSGHHDRVCSLHICRLHSDGGWRTWSVAVW